MKGSIAICGTFGVWQFCKLTNGYAGGPCASDCLALLTKVYTIASRNWCRRLGRQRGWGVGVVTNANSLDEIIAEITTVWLL
jgi:hypothetical protein